MPGNVVKDKSFEFAIRLLQACKRLRMRHKEYDMTRQLLKSGTAIGALIRESEYAESKADFIHKLHVAQKECNETLYWIDLFMELEPEGEVGLQELHSNATELLKLLTSIITTSKRNLNKLKSRN